MRRLVTSVASVVVAAGVMAIAAPEAGARTGSCLAPGDARICTVWTGRVAWVDDGDTLRVDLDGDGSRSTIRVRMTGINAQEQTVYTSNPRRRRGECHALEATARLEQLIRRGHGRVRLAALDGSSRSGIRWRRAVAVKIGGRWQDVGARLVAEGHALWMGNARENAWNAEYSRLAEGAAARRLRMWSPTYCGAGPSDTARLSVQVNADADGDDADSINGEWVRIRNLDPAGAVHLGGWTLRGGLRRFKFPEWVTLTGGEWLTVYAGTGTDTWTDLYWGLRTPLFDNARTGAPVIGDGAYLVDPQGDMRAWMTYPCRTACTDPYRGAVQLTAQPRGSERVTIRNVSAGAVDLDGYKVERSPYVYAFGRDSVLRPGEAMRIEVRGDPASDTALEKHWDKGAPILYDRGGAIRLKSLREVAIDCYAWGTGRC
jgi:endonuclease YncB( thermonuclease family)